LTVRGSGRKIQPMRVVLDPTLRTPLDSIIIKENPTGTTMLVIGDDVTKDRYQAYADGGVHMLRLPVREGVFSWSILADALTEMGVLHVLVEGGGKTAAWMLKEGAVNRLELFMASKFLGSSGVPVVGDMGVTSLKEATSLLFHRIRRIGEDVQITAEIK